MQLEHLRYFSAAVACGSINKAAKLLYCTQPTITNAIKSIEKELGAPLIERTASGICATKLGNHVLNDSRLMLGYVENWKNIAQENDKETQLRIHFTGISPRFFVVDNIIKFQKENPNIRIVTTYLPASSQGISQSQGDSSRFIISYKVPQHLESTKTYAEKHGMQLAIMRDDAFHLFANRENALMKKQEPITAEDLKGHLFLLLQDPMKFPYIDKLLDLDCRIGPQMWHEENLMIALTIDKEALSFRPSKAGAENTYVQNGLISSRVVAELPMPVHLCLLYPTFDRMTDVEKLFIRSLKQTYPRFHNV